MGVYWQDEDTTERIAKCIGCGCTDERACEGGCSWIAVDRAAGKGVCSNCPEKTGELFKEGINAFKTAFKIQIRP